MENQVLNKILEKLDGLQEIVAKQGKKIDELSGMVEDIHYSVAKIEDEHGRKIGSIYDMLSLNQDNLINHDTRISTAEHKIEAIQIDVGALKLKS
ncbi:MAG: hypothetical protein FWD34_03415 [Oscillospiraceae bacterium]|nr:hypothetical protein [Oscillospiraceae bacterium]